MIPSDLYNAVLHVDTSNEPHPSYFDINGKVIRIAGPSEILENLRSFFYPYIPSPAGKCDVCHHHDFTVATNSELYDGLKKQLPASPDEVITTALSHNMEYKLRCFDTASGDVTIIEDEPLKLLYVMAERERATKIIATRDSRTRTGLLRIIRASWVLDTLAGHNALIVHGCVLEKNGHGIVISGEKYAGKTTSLLNLCSTMHYNIVANDRLVLRLNQSDEELSAVGIPTVISLRQKTVNPFPQLHHLMDAPLYGVWDLARALNVDIRRKVAVSAVVFLSYDAGCREPVFRRLVPEESHRRLTPQLFSFGEYDYVRRMRVAEAVANHHDESQGDILSSVSCFQLSSNESQLETLASVMDDWCQRSTSA